MTAHTPHTSDADAVKKVKDLIGDERIAMLTTADADGTLVSRPMALQRLDDHDGALWFLTDTTSPKAQQLERDHRVNLAMQSRGTWISVSGSAELVRDRGIVHDLWNAAAESWFPDGPDTPEVGAIRITPDTAEYWDAPSNPVATVLAYAKSRITGQQPDVGESKVVDL